MARQESHAQPPVENPMAGLISADDLQRLVARHEIEKMEQDEHAHTAAEESKRARMAMLQERRELTPEMIQRAVQRWHAAANQGVTEVELLRFPSELCTDDGRAINNSDPDWVHTLTGVPAQIYEIWEQNLKSRGFKLKASIVDFPNGKPGDVGLYLSWL